jgi:hypothetical protein
MPRRGGRSSLLIRGISEGVEETRVEQYFPSPEKKAKRETFRKKRKLIPVFLRKMLESGAEDELVSDRRKGTNNSPGSSFIP